MILRRTLILIAGCAGLIALSVPAGPPGDTRVVFVKLAKNAAPKFEPGPRHSTGGSVWIAQR